MLLSLVEIRSDPQHSGENKQLSSFRRFKGKNSEGLRMKHSRCCEHLLEWRKISIPWACGKEISPFFGQENWISFPSLDLREILSGQELSWNRWLDDFLISPLPYGPKSGEKREQKSFLIVSSRWEMRRELNNSKTRYSEFRGTSARTTWAHKFDQKVYDVFFEGRRYSESFWGGSPFFTLVEKFQLKFDHKTECKQFRCYLS